MGETQRAHTVGRGVLGKREQKGGIREREDSFKVKEEIKALQFRENKLTNR